ncbi:MAG: FlgD immunoglobulin-like domain containing protein, partial [bacterium]|nr:FlgD immunoglobulin-like domain containing protein [bacterium]
CSFYMRHYETVGFIEYSEACNTLDSDWSEIRSVRVTTVILDPKVISPQTVGNEFIVDVHVGSDTNVSQDLFGVAFSLFYERTDILDVAAVAAIERGPFMGSGTIMIYSVHEDNGDGRGRVDIAISRTAGNPGVTGYGSLVRVKFISSGTATDITFETSDVGHLITAYNSSGEPITIGGSYNSVDIVEPEPVMGVWPGDANNNGVVDGNDIFPVAMYFGMESFMRPGASLVWIGQPMSDPWIPVEATYADTNGDGRITAADVLAIGVNFGATHTVSSGGSPAPALAAKADYAKYLDAFRQMYKMLESNGIDIHGAPELKQALSAAIQTGVEQQEEAKSPDDNVLHQSYPNPFNPECWIPYELSEQAHVVIRIYNISGQLIKTLDEGVKDAGAYTTQSRAAYWDGHNDDGQEVASGVYIYQLQVGDNVMTQRAVVCK